MYLKYLYPQRSYHYFFKLSRDLHLHIDGRWGAYGNQLGGIAYIGKNQGVAFVGLYLVFAIKVGSGSAGGVLHHNGRSRKLDVVLVCYGTRYNLLSPAS